MLATRAGSAQWPPAMSTRNESVTDVLETLVAQLRQVGAGPGEPQSTPADKPNAKPQPLVTGLAGGMFKNLSAAEKKTAAGSVMAIEVVRDCYIAAAPPKHADAITAAFEPYLQLAREAKATFSVLSRLCPHRLPQQEEAHLSVGRVR